MKCQRCDFRTDPDDAETSERDQLGQHAQAADHPLCQVCRRSLTLSEIRTCDRCVQATRDNIDSITDDFARLEAVIEGSGYQNQPIIGGTAMVIVAGGNIEGGGPEDHIAFKDPIDPLAVLEHNERDWRLRFGHGRGDDQATVAGCGAYLLRWLRLAARTHPTFDDFATEIAALAGSLARTTGTANLPAKATAKCIDCDGTLISPYRGSVDLPDGVTREGLPWEGREMRGKPDEEPEPVWECSRCQMIYSPVEYRLAVRIQIEAQSELAG